MINNDKTEIIAPKYIDGSEDISILKNNETDIDMTLFLKMKNTNKVRILIFNHIHICIYRSMMDKIV